MTKRNIARELAIMEVNTIPVESVSLYSFKDSLKELERLREFHRTHHDIYSKDLTIKPRSEMTLGYRIYSHRRKLK